VVYVFLRSRSKKTLQNLCKKFADSDRHTTFDIQTNTNNMTTLVLMQLENEKWVETLRFTGSLDNVLQLEEKLRSFLKNDFTISIG
jgi:Leu/Phe-tRNA-protein transferase